MDCYIVRIYRHEVENPREFVGVVEEVGTEGKRAFTNIDELWEILNTSSESTKKKVKTQGKICNVGIPADPYDGRGSPSHGPRGINLDHQKK